jgi:hypothetical protein
LARSRPSRDGITLFEGDVAEFDGKVLQPGALTIAEWEGLELHWDLQPGDVLVLILTYGSSVSDPILRLPLTEHEAQLIRGHREKLRWGYYDLKVEENDDRAAVNVSFITASDEPKSMLWIIDRKRRAAVRRAMNRFVGMRDPIFAD